MLAGIAAFKHMMPHVSYVICVLGCGTTDYPLAMEQAKFALAIDRLRNGCDKVDVENHIDDRDAGLYIDKAMKTTVRRFVTEEWRNIVALGDRLLASPNGRLSHRQCMRILGKPRGNSGLTVVTK